MAHSLEVRCPFLDTQVVEFASRLPRHMLMRWRGKHLLRKAVADLVPAGIRRRHKQGFGLPLRRWMREDLGTLVRDVLLDRRARERGLFEPREVQRLVESLDRDRNAPDRVWTLLVLELLVSRVHRSARGQRRSPRRPFSEHRPILDVDAEGEPWVFGDCVGRVRDVEAEDRDLAP